MTPCTNRFIVDHHEMLRLLESAPTEQDQERASNGEDWREWQHKTPPVHRARWQENQGEDGPTLPATPYEPTHQAFQDAHQEEPDQKRHRCLKTVSLERTSPVSGKSHDIEDAAARKEIVNRQNAGQAEHHRVDPKQDRGNPKEQRAAHIITSEWGM